MTIEEFLVALEKKVDYCQWELAYGLSIRANSRSCAYPTGLCPIDVVAGTSNGWSRPDILGLSKNDKRAIMATADGARYLTSFNPELRARMLTICGLTEKGTTE